MRFTIPSIPKRYRSRVGAVVAAVVLIGYALLFAPPRDFPTGKLIIVKRGETVSEVATTLAEARLVAHPRVLTLVIRMMGASTRVQTGAYRFPSREGALSIAYRLATGNFGVAPARITIPEGSTVRDIAAIVADALPEVTADEVYAAGARYEGMLFPDTYTFSYGTDAETVIRTMRETFRAKTSPLLQDILASDHSLTEIVTMASLIEKEARTLESKQMISGILWRRLAIGMPLQVDAVFGYIANRPTFSPSYSDLKTDSPYNTYKYKGLPPGPIGSPGYDSLYAALHPTKSPYLFYLTGKDGKMHYATTYAEHQANERKYLR